MANNHKIKQISPGNEPEEIGNTTVADGNVKKTSATGNKLAIPPYHLTMLYMISAKWLSVNDSQEENCNVMFVGGNINLSLICALLFTTYLPLYYSEANRLNNEEDGLTIDINLGYLNRQTPLVLTRAALHDIFDTAYLIAAAATLFGTMVSVFYMLAANEAATDSKTFVLMKYLGPTITQIPYFFFTIGIFGWAFGGLVHVFTVPRTSPGFYIKIIGLWSMIAVMLLLCFPRMIQGVYAGRVAEINYPPLYLSDDQIREKLETFFARPDQDGDLSLAVFLKHCTFLTEDYYRPKLQILTEVKATYMFYEKVAVLTGRSVEEVKEIVSIK
jgi:hypothetical protein